MVRKSGRTPRWLEASRRIHREQKGQVNFDETGTRHCETLDEFDLSLDEVVSNLFVHQCPDVLYHYTDWKGAEGILADQELWATAHHCMEDKDEFKTVDSVAVGVAAGLRNNLIARGSPASTSHLLTTFLQEFAQERLSRRCVGYLTCFSSNRDDPELWDRFGDGGRGLCLGIKNLRGEDGPKSGSNYCGRTLVKVDYDPESWRLELESAFRQVCSLLSHFGSTPEELDVAWAIALSALFRCAAIAAICGKKPALSVEHEWRHVAITVVGKPCGYPVRTRSNGEVEFLSLPFRKKGRLLVFEDVIIGPLQESQAAQERVMTLLQQSGYTTETTAMPRISMSTHSCSL